MLRPAAAEVRVAVESWAQDAAQLEQRGHRGIYLAAVAYQRAYAEGWSQELIAEQVTRAGFPISQRAVSNRLAALEGLAVTAEPSISDVAAFAERYAGVNNAVDLGGLKSSTSVEWYTPEPILETARTVLGRIDLDPASSALANEVVQADTYFAKDDDPDGLSQDWFGRVWLNPPYGKGTGLFTTKLVDEYSAGRVQAGILLINAYGFDAAWFEPLWDWPLCFTRDRIVFYSPQRVSGGPANGNVLAYLGPEPDRFADVFSDIGTIVRRWP